MVTLLVMGIITSATLAVALRAFTDTGIVLNRREVLGDGQLALQRLTKQLRQGESVNEALSTPTHIEFESYLDGQPVTIEWDAAGTQAPYRLEQSIDGGTPIPLFLALTDPNVFTYSVHDGVLDQVTVSLALGTRTSTVVIHSDVDLRNANAI
jgi:hypothetical protein